MGLVGTALMIPSLELIVTLPEMRNFLDLRIMREIFFCYDGICADDACKDPDFVRDGIAYFGRVELTDKIGDKEKSNCGQCFAALDTVESGNEILKLMSDIDYRGIECGFRGFHDRIHCMYLYAEAATPLSTVSGNLDSKTAALVRLTTRSYIFANRKLVAVRDLALGDFIQLGNGIFLPLFATTKSL